MKMYDIIQNKRNGMELTKEEIEFFVNGYTEGSIPDYQAAALLMAIYFQKMNKRETADLTMAMVNSGDILDLNCIKGIKVDKHSTGGVGDKTTLVLAALVASLNIPVAKMSGRGLGHTGGTIDKLESFPGFSTNLSKERFVDNVNKYKLALSAQTGNLAPADKKLYALRNVTATVENISLIASSVMSKKIASGADAIVLDVKVGEGAFMKDIESARSLAEEMVGIGKNLGRKTVAVISDMDEPLGFAVGNALEVMEAIETLRGRGPKDLEELCLVLGSHMVVLAGKNDNLQEARLMLMENIKNGKALMKFREFIEAQGGNAGYIENPDQLISSEFILPVISKNTGIVNKIHAENIGRIAMELGAGRAVKDAPIDFSVGLVLNKKKGDSVREGEILAQVYSNDISKAEAAVSDVLKSYEISENLQTSKTLIYDVIT